MRSVALLLAGVGGAGVFFAQVGTHYALRDWAVWGILKAWAWSTVWIVACLAGGHTILRFVVRGTLRIGEHATLAVATGALAFFLLQFVTGIVGGFGSVGFFVVPALLLGLGARASYRTGARLRRHLRQARTRRSAEAPSVANYVAAGVGLLGLALIYFQILSPDNIAYDARWYHLPIAEDYVVHGGIRRFPEGWVPGAYPQLATLIYAWAFALPGGSLLDKVTLCAHLEFAVLVVTLAGVPALVRRLLKRTRAPFAWVAFVLFPGIYVYDSALCLGADHVAALWTIPVWLAFVRVWRSWTARDGAFFSAMLSGALLTKYTAVIIVFPPLALFAVRAVVELGRGLTRRSLTPMAPALAGLATGLLLTAPHWLKNLIFYHDPLFPSGASLFPSDPWLPEAAMGYEQRFMYPWARTPRTLEGVVQSFQTLYNFSFVPNNFPYFHGAVPVFGSVFTLSLVGLPFVHGVRRVWALVLALHAGILLWYWTHHFDRFLQALVPGMIASVAAIGIAAWRTGWAARVGVTALAGAQFLWGLDHPFIPSHIMSPGSSALRSSIDFVQSGYMKQFATRVRVFEPFPTIAGRLGTDSRVLLHDIHGHLGIGATTVSDWPSAQGGISYQRHPSPRDLHLFLRKLGVTHILWPAGASHAGDSLAGDLVFYRFAVEHVTKTESIGGYMLATLSKKPPRAIKGPQPVLMLTCRGPHPPGLYPLSELTQSPFDPQPRAPRAPEPPGADPLQTAAFVVDDPSCPDTLTPESRLRLQLLATRWHLRLFSVKR